VPFNTVDAPTNLVELSILSACNKSTQQHDGQHCQDWRGGGGAEVMILFAE
jgi:hypothetical protein